MLKIESFRSLISHRLLNFAKIFRTSSFYDALMNGALFLLFMLIVAELSPNIDCLQIQYQGFLPFSEVLVDCIN